MSVYHICTMDKGFKFFFVLFCRKKQVQKPKMEADDLPQTLKLVCLLPRSNLTTFLETRPKRRLHTDRATCDLVAQPAAYVGWSALSRDHFWPYFSGCGAVNTEIIKSGTDVKFMFRSRICSSWGQDPGFRDIQDSWEQGCVMLECEDPAQKWMISH